MAKRASRRNTTVSSRRIESKVVDYAEELGRLLGTVRARVDNIVVERGKLVDQLAGVVKEAQGLLAELGHEAAARVSQLAGARGRKRKTAKIPKKAAGGTGAKKRRLPATTRQKVAKRRSTGVGATSGGGAEGSEA